MAANASALWQPWNWLCGNPDSHFSGCALQDFASNNSFVYTGNLSGKARI
jgi:hypothetical protein